MNVFQQRFPSSLSFDINHTCWGVTLQPWSSPLLMKPLTSPSVASSLVMEPPLLTDLSWGHISALLPLLSDHSPINLSMVPSCRLPIQTSLLFWWYRCPLFYPNTKPWGRPFLCNSPCLDLAAFLKWLEGLLSDLGYSWPSLNTALLCFFLPLSYWNSHCKYVRSFFTFSSCVPYSLFSVLYSFTLHAVRIFSVGLHFQST